MNFIIRRDYKVLIISKSNLGTFLLNMHDKFGSLLVHDGNPYFI